MGSDPFTFTKKRGLTPFVDKRLNQHLGKTAVEPAALAGAIADLEEYCREPIAVIAERYWAAPKAPAAQSPEALTAFYATGDRYLYESTYTEGYADHQRMAQVVVAAVRRWRLTPVLDFGGGGGGLTLALARRGLAVEYADVPGKMTDFVRWRLGRHGLSVPLHDATQPLSAGRYRAVLAVDVLEHVSDLVATVRRLLAALQPGGWLIGTHSFMPDDPLHLASSHQYGDLKTFDALMQTEGFRYQGRLKPAFWGVCLSPKLKGGGNLLVYERRRG